MVCVLCREPEIWDVKSCTHLYNLPPQTDGVYSTAMTDSGRLAVTGSSSPSLTVWDTLSPPVEHTTQLHPGEDISSVALSGCGGLGVCTSSSGRVCVFDADTMTMIQRLQPHSGPITQVLVYKDRNKLFSASADGTLCLWNGETGEILERFGEESPINCLAITTGKDLMMTGAEDGEVAFWSVDTQKKLRQFSDHESGVLAVAFITQSKDQFMLSTSRDGSLCIREFYSAKVVVSTQCHTDNLTCTAIAPSSLFMVSGSLSGTSQIISLPHGTLAATLVGHTSTVNCVRVFPDSTRCVTGSSDRTIRVWTIESALCSAVLYLDQPVLACDVNYSNIVLCGTEGGWVCTAVFQPDPCKPNALVSRLNAGGSPTVSSSTATPVLSREGSRVDTLGSGECSKSDNQLPLERAPPSITPKQEGATATMEETDFGCDDVNTDPATGQPRQNGGKDEGGGHEGVGGEGSKSVGGSADTESVPRFPSERADTDTAKSSTCTLL